MQSLVFQRWNLKHHPRSTALPVFSCLFVLYLPPTLIRGGQDATVRLMSPVYSLSRYDTVHLFPEGALLVLPDRHGLPDQAVVRKCGLPSQCWQRSRQDLATLLKKIRNKSTIVDCKLFSQSHCRELLYLPRPPHLWYNAHCTRNIVTTQLQYCFVNYFHNILGTMVQYFL